MLRFPKRLYISLSVWLHLLSTIYFYNILVSQKRKKYRYRYIAIYTWLMLTYIEITWKTLFGRYSCLIIKQSIAFVLKSMFVTLNHHFKHHLHQSHPCCFPNILNYWTTRIYKCKKKMFVRKFLMKSNRYLLQGVNLRLRSSFPLDFLNVVLLWICVCRFSWLKSKPNYSPVNVASS